MKRVDLFEKGIPKVKIHKPTKVTVTPIELKMKKEIARLEKIDKEKAEKAKKIFQEIQILKHRLIYVYKSKKEQKKYNDKEQEYKKLQDDMLPPKLKVAIKYIKKNCSDILSILKKQNRFLFRGVDTIDTGIEPFIANSPTNRRPLDSSKESQIQIDNMLKNEGFKALRSNSVFMTSNYSQAEYFGEVFYVFPINGFSYTWNVKYEDFVNNEGLTKIDQYCIDKWEKYSDMITNYLDRANDKFYELKNEDKKIPKELKILDNITDDFSMMQFLDNYFDVKTDFLPRCKKLGAISLYNYVDKLIKTLESKVPTSAKLWGFTNTDIEKAIKKEHEIFINGKYVAIPEYLTAKLDDHEFRNLLFRK